MIKNTPVGLQLVAYVL